MSSSTCDINFDTSFLVTFVLDVGRAISMVGFRGFVDAFPKAAGARLSQ